VDVASADSTWLGRLLQRSTIPVELDIGCNNGSFLVKVAQANPNRMFVGVEIQHELADRASQRCRSARLENTVVVPAEAMQFLKQHVPSDSVDSMHIYFPTPFPKESRLLDAAFFREASRVVCLGGRVKILTDHGGYAKAITEAASAPTWSQVPWQSVLVGQPPDLWVGSDWEVKMREEGKIVFPVQLLKTK
jgi:tRNA (guanine-N7-)-methyltransferase